MERKLKESEENVHLLVKTLEKVKIENKELRTIQNVPNSISKNSHEDDYDEEDKSELDSERALLKGKESGFRRDGPQAQSVKLFPCSECGQKLKDQYNLDLHTRRHQNLRKKCKECGETFKTENDLDFHTKYEHKSISQWNCMDCSFQSTSKDQLKSHINFKHTKDTNIEVYKCEVCKRQFRSVWHLNNHIRDEHGKEKECIFYKENRCKFGNACWKEHKENRGTIIFTCYSCKETFKSINDLMSHRKKKHIDLVKPCEPKNGNCRFDDHPEKCWFIHKDFLQATKNQAPP